VSDDELMTLIHAELDGDLGSEQRAALARLLLADPRARALRDEVRGVSSRLDAVGQVEPPPQLKDSILRRLPSAPVARTYRETSFSRWRLAAMAAGLLTAGTIVYETVQGPAPGSREIAGTMAADSWTAVDSVAVGSGPVTGRATLYRDKGGLAVGVEMSATEPVDVVISTGGQSFRINGLGSSKPAGSTHQTVALPGVQMQGQDIQLSFLIGERTVGRASLRAPRGP
jgi:anti-sigma factor RsiW